MAVALATVVKTAEKRNRLNNNRMDMRHEHMRSIIEIVDSHEIGRFACVFNASMSTPFKFSSLCSLSLSRYFSFRLYVSRSVSLEMNKWFFVIETIF